MMRAITRGCRACACPSAAAVLSFAFTLALAACMLWAPAAWAAPGTVYSCQVQRSYAHPVTGQVEDAGGTSAQATGQAMVESCIDGAGMLEVADDGSVFLTIRMNLMDLTSNHAFQVQEWGSDGWSDPALGVTQTGSNDLGDTSDVCIQLPARESVVRVSLYVNQMGRDVVCFCYPGELAQGAPDGFVATMVTEPSQSGAPDAVEKEAPATAGAAEGVADDGAADGDAANGGTADAAGAADAAAAGDASTGDAPSAADGIEGAGLPSAQGLSLSTAPEGEAQVAQDTPSDAAQAAPAASAGANSPFEVAAAVVAAGIILMLAASAIVYWFRRNWNRIGAADPDDYSREYRHA